MKITDLPDNFRPAKSTDDAVDEFPNQENKIQFAYLAAVLPKVETLTGLARRFRDEKNPKAQAAASELAQLTLQKHQSLIPDPREIDDQDETEAHLNIKAMAQLKHAEEKLKELDNYTPQDDNDPDYLWYNQCCRFITQAKATEYLSDEARQAHLHQTLSSQTTKIPRYQYTQARKAFTQATTLQNNKAENNRLEIAKRDNNLPRPKGASRRLRQHISQASNKAFDAAHIINPIRRTDFPTKFSPSLEGKIVDMNWIEEAVEEFRNSINDYSVNISKGYDETTEQIHELDLIIMEGENSIIVKLFEDPYPLSKERRESDLEINHHLNIIERQCENMLRSPKTDANNRNACYRLIATARMNRACVNAGIAYTPRKPIYDVIAAVQQNTGLIAARRVALAITGQNRDLAYYLMENSAQHNPQDTTPYRIAIEAGLPYPVISAVMTSTGNNTPAEWQSLINEYPQIPEFTTRLSEDHLESGDHTEIDQWLMENDIPSWHEARPNNGPPG